MLCPAQYATQCTNNECPSFTAISSGWRLKPAVTSILLLWHAHDFVSIAPSETTFPEEHLQRILIPRLKLQVLPSLCKLILHFVRQAMWSKSIAGAHESLTLSRGAKTTQALAPSLMHFFISRFTILLPMPFLCARQNSHQLQHILLLGASPTIQVNRERQQPLILLCLTDQTLLATLNLSRVLSWSAWRL